MRILFLITSSSLMDGIARYILTVSEYLSAQQSLKVAVCVAHSEGDLTYALRKTGVCVYVLGCKHGHDWRIFPMFHKVMKDFMPTLIHSHVMAVNIHIYLSLFAKHVPIVSTVHGVGESVMSRRNRIRKGCQRILTGCFPITVQQQLVISSGTKEALKNRPWYSKSLVSYNPISLENLPQRDGGWLKRELRIPGSSRVVGFVGRLANQKDLMSFLKVAQVLRQEAAEYHFVIVGGGPDEKLKDSKIACEMKERIHWMGSRKDARRIIAGLDVFVLTSWWEGLPTVLLEAFAIRTPLCAFVSPGGVAEIEQLGRKYADGVGWFVESRDVNALACAIKEAIDNASRAHDRTENAYQLLKDTFDVRVVGQQLLGIYKKTIADMREGVLLCL